MAVSVQSVHVYAICSGWVRAGSGRGARKQSGALHCQHAVLAGLLPWQLACLGTIVIQVMRGSKGVYEKQVVYPRLRMTLVPHLMQKY